MLPIIGALVIGFILLIISTDQFVSGAAVVARDLKVSSVLIGAVILGCGTGLPELALAFYSSHTSPWREALHLRGQGGQGVALAVFFMVLALIFVLPSLVPGRIPRHSPIILIATIMFSTLLRGSLDQFEGFEMLVGFVIGAAWILRGDRKDNDPFAPLIDDDFGSSVAYVEAPVLTPMQVGITRSLFGLLGTAAGAQLLAFGALTILKQHHGPDLARNLTFVCLGSLLPHLVVAMQALRRHDESLAIGNLIGSSLFNSLAIGGLVAIIRPYQAGGHFGLLSIGVVASTALLTWMLLHTEAQLSPKQGLVLLAAYSGLIVFTVL